MPRQNLVCCAQEPEEQQRKAITRKIHRKAYKPKATRQPFPFLKLPAELRNRVYRFTLTPGGCLELTDTIKKNRRHVAIRESNRRYWPVDQVHISPNLLRVSKQIYYEALPVLYGQPLRFCYSSGPSALCCFLSQIGKHGVRMLQTIEIELLKVGKRSDFTHPAFTLLVDAINLQLLRIKTLHQRGGRAKTFPDIEVGTMTRLFFPVAHVWIEQMAKYRTDGKDWKDILSLAKSDHWDGLYSWQACPDACKSFCSEVEKLRSE